MTATRGQFGAQRTETETLSRVCEAADCAEAGAFRAPRSPAALRDFRWFCLKHVREYNLAWDYYKGMSTAEIEANLRSDSMWQRPTWPLGRLGHAAKVEQILEDELHVAFGDKTRAPAQAKLPSELHDALEALDLAWPVSLNAVKAKYKKLAKRYHPDANDGDKKSEEMFKAINLAYTTIRGKFADFLLRNAASPAE
jgi:hypothetical protein